MKVSAEDFAAQGTGNKWPGSNLHLSKGSGEKWSLGVEEMAQRLRASQSFVAPVQGHSTPLSDLLRHWASTWCIDMHPDKMPNSLQKF